MEKVQDLVLDVDHTVRLYAVTIYISVDSVLEKQHQNLDSKNMSRRK